MLNLDDFRDVIDRHPLLYHVVYRAGPETRESIKENGLVSGRSRHCWHPLWRPREGCVYLATADRIKRVRNWGSTSYEVDVYSVDTRILVPRRITPDEDWFINCGKGQYDGPVWGDENWVGGKHPTQVFNLPLPPNMWLYEKMTSWGLTVPSFGEWADAVKLDTPAQTRFSIDRGTIAYRGEVSPRALKLVFTTQDAADRADCS